MDSVDPRGTHLSKAFISNGNNRELLPVSQTSHFSQNHLSKSNNLDMFALELAAIELNLDSSNPGTSKHPYMSNRIYETLDSEYIGYIS